jgi:hypothetical protein
LSLVPAYLANTLGSALSLNYLGLVHFLTYFHQAVNPFSIFHQ